VFDRGIVSEENLRAIPKWEGQYLVGTPRSQMKQLEAELPKQDWIQVRPEVEPVAGARKLTFCAILCRTAGRKDKEKAIRRRFSNRMETASNGLEKTIATGRLKDRKMERADRLQLHNSQSKGRKRNKDKSDLEISVGHHWITVLFEIEPRAIVKLASLFIRRPVRRFRQRSRRLCH
jgi:hypothetical protein